MEGVSSGGGGGRHLRGAVRPAAARGGRERERETSGGRWQDSLSFVGEQERTGAGLN